MEWDPGRKPPRGRCPERFCFHWDDPDEAHPQGACGSPFGVCSRANPSATTDWYEPHEPRLERSRLPWFYFVSDPASLTPEAREAYVRESEALWGPRHWAR
jgi:hypothetical protein